MARCNDNGKNYNCNDDELVETCGRTTNMKDNCVEDPGEEIEINCGSIDDAVCVGILVDKIYDCTSGQECPQFADKEEEFTIMGEDSCRRSSFEEGASICIDEIGLCYDYLGLKDENDDEDGGQILVKYDSVNREFDSVIGTEFALEGEDTLYNEFEGTISRTPCTFRTNNPEDVEAVKSKVFKGNIRVHAANLRVMISGRIGCRRFTAIKEYDPIVEITRPEDEYEGLNLSPVNLYSRVSTPNDGRVVKSNIKFTPCLAVECATTDDVYAECRDGKINATVTYSLVSRSRVRHTTNEEIAVFTNPDGVQCNDSDEESSCL